MTAETVTCTKVRCPLGNPAHASEKNTAPAAPPGRHASARCTGTWTATSWWSDAAELVRLVRLDLAAEPERIGAGPLVGRAARRMRRERVPDGRR